MENNSKNTQVEIPETLVKEALEYTGCLSDLISVQYALQGRG